MGEFASTYLMPNQVILEGVWKNKMQKAKGSKQEHGLGSKGNISTQNKLEFYAKAKHLPSQKCECLI